MSKEKKFAYASLISRDMCDTLYPIVTAIGFVLAGICFFIGYTWGWVLCPKWISIPLVMALLMFAGMSAMLRVGSYIFDRNLRRTSYSEEELEMDVL